MENLALLRPYTITSDGCTEYSSSVCEKGRKDILTDGRYGDTKDYYSGRWAHFVRGLGRNITVDLGRKCKIDSVKMSFIQEKEPKIFCPEFLTVYLSNDNNGFFRACTVAKPISNTQKENARAEYICNINGYTARYVRVNFDVQNNLFTDEIEIYGSEDTQNGREITPSFFDDRKEKEYFDSGRQTGAKDIMCFHNGYNPKDPTRVNNTRAMFKPYLGYVDENGNYIDTMYDAIMFLTLKGQCPSGGSFTSSGGPTLLSDWEYLLDNTFKDNINVSAIDEETGEMKKVLNLSDDYKTGIYLTVPYPKISDLVVGDYRRNGRNEKISSKDDCVDAYRYYVSESKKRFCEKHYKNVSFKGFFWFNESIDNHERDYETEITPKCVNAAHEYGLQVIFIPSWQAPGSQRAWEMGFDSVIMQPNLSFMEFAQRDPEAFMNDFVKTAKKYHFGMQAEMKENMEFAEPKYRKYYLQYLKSGAESGIMTDAVHAYYQGAGKTSSIIQCAYSKNKEVRRLYDLTYKFIKGKLDPREVFENI